VIPKVSPFETCRLNRNRGDVGPYPQYAIQGQGQPGDRAMREDDIREEICWLRKEEVVVSQELYNGVISSARQTSQGSDGNTAFLIGRDVSKMNTLLVYKNFP
jgi:hypothetical protein